MCANVCNFLLSHFEKNTGVVQPQGVVFSYHELVFHSRPVLMGGGGVTPMSIFVAAAYNCFDAIFSNFLATLALPTLHPHFHPLPFSAIPVQLFKLLSKSCLAKSCYM